MDSTHRTRFGMGAKALQFFGYLVWPLQVRVLALTRAAVAWTMRVALWAALAVPIPAAVTFALSSFSPELEGGCGFLDQLVASYEQLSRTTRIRPADPADGSPRVGRVSMEVDDDSRLYEDGSVCAHYQTTDTRLDDANPGAGFVSREVRTCERRCPCSNTGLLSEWRRSGGRWPAMLYPRALTLGPIVGALLVAFYAALAAGAGMLMLGLSVASLAGALASLGALIVGLTRGGKVIVSAWSIPRSIESASFQEGPAPTSHRIHVVSDLHLCEGTPYEFRTNPEEWPYPDTDAATHDRFVEVMSRVQKEIAGGGGLLLVAGDITDMGESRDWDRFATMFSSAADSGRPQLLMIPGNHDTVIRPYWRYDTKPPAGARFFYDLAMMLLPRACHPERREQMFPCVLSLDADGSLQEQDERATRRDGAIHLVLLDSTRYPSTNLFSNAVGLFGHEQLSALSRKLARLDGPLLLVTHHHVAVPAAEGLSFTDRVFAAFNVALDSGVLVRMLLGYSARTGQTPLVLHGHRHIQHCGSIEGAGQGRIVIYGMPSSTLGNKEVHQLDGLLYAAELGRAAGEWSIRLHAWAASQRPGELPR